MSDSCKRTKNTASGFCFRGKKSLLRKTYEERSFRFIFEAKKYYVPATQETPLPLKIYPQVLLCVRALVAAAILTPTPPLGSQPKFAGIDGVIYSKSV